VKAGMMALAMAQAGRLVDSIMGANESNGFLMVNSTAKACVQRH
jgi:hypothetical protein